MKETIQALPCRGMPTVDKRGKVTSSGIEKAGTPLQSPAGIKNDKEKKKVGVPANGHK